MQSTLVRTIRLGVGSLLLHKRPPARHGDVIVERS
jgi:hypothetical protein